MANLLQTYHLKEHKIACTITIRSCHTQIQNTLSKVAYLIHVGKHSQHIDNPKHIDKCVWDHDPNTIAVKDLVDRFIDFLVEGEETIIEPLKIVS